MFIQLCLKLFILTTLNNYVQQILTLVSFVTFINIYYFKYILKYNIY